MRLVVPDWQVNLKDGTFSTGVFRIERGPGTGQIQVGWTSGTPRTEGILPNILAGMKSGGIEVKVAGSKPVTISGHGGTTYQLQAVANPELTVYLTTWYCPRDKRHILIRSIKVARAIHDDVIDSIKCHTGTKGRSTVAFARFDPPPGVRLSGKRADRVAYTSKVGEVILLPGISGSVGRAFIADSPQGRDARARYLSMLAGKMLSGIPTHFSWPRQQKASAFFALVQVTFERRIGVFAVTFFHCKANDTVYPVAFLGLASTSRGHMAGLLLRAACPK